MNLFKAWNCEKLSQAFISLVEQHEQKYLKIKSKYRAQVDDAGRIRMRDMALLPNETIEECYLRIAIAIWETNFSMVEQLYKYCCELKVNFSRVALEKAGFGEALMSSCFLETIGEDDYLEKMHIIGQLLQKGAAVGVSVDYLGHKDGTTISGERTRGIFNIGECLNAICNVTRGRSFHGDTALYIPIWNAELLEVLDHYKAKPWECVKIAVTTCDLFMKRVINDEQWTFFYNEVDMRKLADVIDDEFAQVYTELEQTATKKMSLPARSVMNAIVGTKLACGVPYEINRDTINRHSNQRNLGMIHGSNLCAEIVQVVNNDVLGVCILGTMIPYHFKKVDVASYKDLDEDISKALPMFIDQEEFLKATMLMTKSVDKMIDSQHFTNERCKNQAFGYRPLGMSIAGISDIEQDLMVNRESEEALLIHEYLYSMLYYGALSASIDLAKVYGPYKDFEKTDFAQGVLQFDYYKYTPKFFKFDKIKEDLKKYGARNSLLTTCLPTAGSSVITRVNPSASPNNTNIRLVANYSGDFHIINEILYKKLAPKYKREEITLYLKNNYGSIKGFHSEDCDMIDLNVFQTKFEVSLTNEIRLAARRQYFIDQAQSLNLYISEETHPGGLKYASTGLFASALLAYKLQLKTISYYTETFHRIDPIKLAEKREQKSCEDNLECRFCV